MKDMSVSKIVVLALILAAAPALYGQMNPYFTAINYPAPQGSLMVMLLPDLQRARTGPDFLTTMGMAEYGITPRWTVGFMFEGQKIAGLPTTYGGMRFSTYVQLFPHDHLLHFTLYAEYEDLNQAALYKMEVSGFGGEDLSGPLSLARRAPARTFETRAIVYHDWGRINATFNFITETALQSPHENNFGYVWGVFRQPRWMGEMGETASMAGGDGPAPPLLSAARLGMGLEMMGALGDTRQFGFYWGREQQYLGPVFSYAWSRHWSFRVEPTFGLSDVSDPFVLRFGLSYTIGDLAGKLRRVFARGN